MRVGILTFHEADNYGAVLQAYALQTALERLGVESEFVVFERGDLVRISEKAEVKKGPAAFARRIAAEREKRAALFDAFRGAWLKCSPPIAREQAGKLNDVYDLFLAGSDQIWNLQIPEADERYFLPFASPEKRASYAASFGGNDIPEQARSWCARQLSCFHALSVREEEGREVVKRLTGRDCAVCLDPVFLLDRADWERMAPKTAEEPYILLHMVNYDAQLAAGAQKLAQERGWKLRVVTAGFLPQYGFPAWNGVGVEDWLSLIQNAAFVFTNSFHGVAFSLIFGRPFSVVRLGEELSGRNGRIEELLRHTGMERCLHGEPAVLSEEELERRLNTPRQASIDYLRDVISHERTL